MSPSRLIHALIVVALLGVAGCGPNTTSPGPSASSPASPPTASSVASPDTSAVYEAIEGQVVVIRGLEPKAGVERGVLDEAELRTRITALFDKESPPEYVAANERLYKALGLLPDEASLRDVTLDLLGGGIDGFYDNEEHKLYVVARTGAIGAVEKITFAHEYTHALQDQHFTVFRDQKGVRDQTDRLLARQAAYEGDASLLMTLWAGANFDQADIVDYLKRASDPTQQELLDRAPAILREQALYPYTTGLVFTQGLQLEGGWAAVDAMYERLPVSTEQILHPERYRSGEEPIPVDIPADLASAVGSGWTSTLEDSFGEFQMGVWLRENGIAASTATKAAAGWGGDRLVVLEGPDGAWAIGLDTAWDSAAEADEFVASAGLAVESNEPPATVIRGAGTRVTVVVASDGPSLDAVSSAFTRAPD